MICLVGILSMCVLQETTCKINIVGIIDHESTGLPIVVASMVLIIVGMFHEYTQLGKTALFMPLVNLNGSILRSTNVPRLLVGNITLTPLKVIQYLSPSIPDLHVFSQSVSQLIMTFRHSHIWSSFLQKNGTQLSSTMGLTWDSFQTLPLLLSNPSFKSPRLMSLGS